MKWIKMRKVKQEDTFKNGMEFHLRERGVGDECGKVPVLVRGGEEFITLSNLTLSETAARKHL